jgi:hypothetical protein
MFEQLKKPEICDALESIEMALFKEDESKRKHIDFKKMVEDVVINVNDNNEEVAKEMKKKLIREFVENFNNDMMRNPTKQEITNNLKLGDNITIEEIIIDEFIANEMNHSKELTLATDSIV